MAVSTVNIYAIALCFGIRHTLFACRHEDTGVLLASGSRKYGRPISGQQEVCGKKKQVGSHP